MDKLVITICFLYKFGLISYHNCNVLFDLQVSEWEC